MYKKIIICLLSLAMSLTVTSCGKRGDLLPPPGYEAPKENNT